MRSLLSCILVFLSFQLFAQAPTEEARWQRFLSTNWVSAATATDDAIWLITDGYLTKVDLAEERITTGIHAELNGFHPISFLEGFYQAGDGTFVALDYDAIYVITENSWERYPVIDILGNSLRKLLKREEDGKYLFLAYGSGVVHWSAGDNYPAPADTYNEQVPFTIKNAAWDATEEKMWVCNDDALGYLRNGVFSELAFPVTDQMIYELRVDNEQRLWVRTRTHLLSYDGVEWKSYAFTEPLTLTYKYQFLSIGDGQALLLTEDRKLLLRPAAGSVTYDTVDYTQELDFLDPNQGFTVDGTGRVWAVDRNERAVVSWRPGETVKRPVRAWAPRGRISTLARDGEGSIWLRTLRGIYNYRLDDWQNGESVLPGMPDGKKHIFFSPSGQAVIRVVAEEGQGYYAYRGAGHWRRFADTVFQFYNMRRTEIDAHGYLQSADISTGGFSVWWEGNFESVGPGDFFPAPVSLYALHLEKNGTQWCVSSEGVYRRFGGYEFYPFADADFPPDFSLSYEGLVKFSPSGLLWLAFEDKVYIWRPGGVERLPPFFAETDNPEGLHCLQLFPLRDDDVWIQLSDRTLAHYDGHQWRHYASPVLVGQLPYFNQLVRDDRGRVWLYGYGDLWVFTPDEDTLLATEQAVPTSLTVAANPIRHNAWISWWNTEAGPCRLSLYSVNGQTIRILSDQIREQGTQTFPLSRDGLPAGIYLLILDGPTGREVRRVVFEG